MTFNINVRFRANHMFKCELLKIVEDYYTFDLPSVLLHKRTDKFISNYRNSGNDVCKFLCAN